MACRKSRARSPCSRSPRRPRAASHESAPSAGCGRRIGFGRLRRKGAGRRLQAGQVPGQARHALVGQRLAGDGTARRQVDQGRPHELGRGDQAAPARAARAPAHLPIGDAMAKLCGMASAFLLSLFAVSAAAQQGQPSEIPEQQRRQVTQPANNAPVWREVRREGQEHFTSIKGRETNVLVQSAGDTWRRIRNGPVMFYGGWLLVLVIAAILGLYLWKGPVKLHEPLSGRQMRRFNALEMTVHWTTAISFCLLGLSGLIMFFGKNVLLPLMGYTLFALLTQLSKNLHNFIAPLFIVSVAVMVVIWLRDNVFRSYD